MKRDTRPKYSQRPKAPPPAPSPDYEPGRFTALMRRHNWPPMFEPKFVVTRDAEVSAIARDARERMQAQGHTGTIAGLSDKSTERLRWMSAPGYMR
jgi:hypothetical protein